MTSRYDGEIGETGWIKGTSFLKFLITGEELIEKVFIVDDSLLISKPFEIDESLATRHQWHNSILELKDGDIIFGFLLDYYHLPTILWGI